MDNKTILNANSSLDISELSDSNSEESIDHLLYKPNWLNLLKNLSEFYLESLKLIFREKTDALNNPGLSKIEFCDAMKQIFGKENFVVESLSLFNEIDRENSFVVSWDQFLDFLRQNVCAEEFPRMELCQPIMIDIPHVQRDTIRTIISLESEKYFSYAIVTIYGKVGLYNGNLELLTTYSVIMTREDISISDDDRRIRNRWITDAIYMEDNFMIFYANSTRSLTIYDASGLNHTPLWLILGFPNIIECLAYTRQKSKIQNSILLYLGYDIGKKISIEFKKQHDLFPQKQNDKLTVLYWREVKGDDEFIRLKKIISDHKNNVKYMEYFPEQNKLISCSFDPKKSVVIDYMKTKNNSYVFKMHRGTNCFAYSSNLDILITGSEDGFVRIFNPVVTQKPILASVCHRCGIVDVAIFSVIGFFVTISRDAELRLWEINEFKCVQVVKIKFPCFRERQIIEWGVKCFFSGPKRQNKKAILNENFMTRDWFLDDEDIEIAATKNANKKNICADYWERSNILVICCNNVCKIGLNFYDNKNRNFDSPVLPIQPLLNSVLIPNDWSLGVSIEKSTGKIKTVLTEEDKSLQGKIDKSIEELKFVLDRNLTGFINKNHETNLKLVQLEGQKRKMQFYVENGAPFLALDLYEPEELQIPIHLPVPNKPKIEKLVAQTRSVLSNAKARDIIFSDISSSTKSLSSFRSSFMDLN